ncbi:hypothetical protein STEG23_009297 [Scotinomys teguina]
MSRRKQAKPQHLRSLEPQPECNDPGGVAPRIAGERASALGNKVPKPSDLSAEDSDTQQAPAVVPLPSEAKEQSATLGERTFNCCYPGCRFKTVHGMKDLDRHLRIHTGQKLSSKAEPDGKHGSYLQNSLCLRGPVSRLP